MLFWRPHPENPLIFFAIAGLWGVGDAVWQTQINGMLFIHRWYLWCYFESFQFLMSISSAGLYGLLFRRNKEAAFSNYRLWESAGFVIAYAYSTTLCARMKLYVLFGNLVLGVIGYIIVEIRHRRKVSALQFQLELTWIIIKDFVILMCFCFFFFLSHSINRNED